MKIAIGSDHAGYQLKEQIIAFLTNENYEVIDQGTYETISVDYPDYATKVAKMVKAKEADFGILICYTGIGMSIAANKFKGIRAALVCNLENASLTRQHNDANILCLSSKDIPIDLAKKMIEVFLTTSFLGERHERRVDKINQIEL